MKGFQAYILTLLLVMFVAGCRHMSLRGSDNDDTVRVHRLIERQKHGQKLRNHGEFYAAIAEHDTCIMEAKELNDTIQLILALNNQGTNYRRLSDLKEASNYHYAALELCDEYSDKTSFQAVKNTVKTLNGLGNILLALGNLEASETMFRRALEGETKLESHTGMAINLANLGSIKQKQGDIDSARVYFMQSMEQNRKDNNAIGISLCYLSIGRLDELDGNIPDATANYRLSYATGIATGDIWHWLEPCSALASLYLDTHRTDSAKYYIDEALKAAQQIESMEHLSVAYILKSRLEEQNGQTAMALADYRRGHAYEDSISNETSSGHVYNMRLDYEAKRHAEDVRKSEERADFEHSVSVLVAVGSLVFFVMLSIVFVILVRAYRARREAAKTLEQVNEQLLKANKERQMFYRGITHQLRTPLTVVLGMIQQLRKHIPADDLEGIASIDAAQRQSGEVLQLVSHLINASKEGNVEVLPEGVPTPAVVTNSSDVAPDGLLRNVEVDIVSDTTDDNATCILVVEDNDDVAMLVCNAFKGEGYRVQRAADGMEAMAMLQERLPDLVVTDIAMPNMNGLELMRSIRADEDMNHLPIIVASARVEDSDRLEGINAGAEVYLAKPFIVDELLLRAQKLIEQRALLRRKFCSSATIDDAVPVTDENERIFIEKLNEVIDENLSQSNLNSTILCQLLFMSRSQLNRKIKNITDMDTTHYIRERRMTRVKHMLVHTDKPIGDIEIACGFETQGYLSRMFKQEVGVSPTVFRRQEREKNAILRT